MKALNLKYLNRIINFYYQNGFQLHISEFKVKYNPKNRIKIDETWIFELSEKNIFLLHKNKADSSI